MRGRHAGRARPAAGRPERDVGPPRATGPICRARASPFPEPLAWMTTSSSSTPARRASSSVSIGSRGGEGWRMDAQGQIEGIGTSPRLAAEDEAGAVLVTQPLGGLACATGVPRSTALAAWLRSRYGGAANVVGVGHRVVHGGSAFAAPTVVTPRVLGELRTLIPLAPLHQPHNLAAIDAVAERMPGVPQVACFDTELPPGRASRRRAGPAARAHSGRWRAPVRLSRAVVPVHRVRAARRSRQRSPTAASSSPTSEAVRACAP